MVFIKKIKFNKKYLEICFYVLGVIILAISFDKLSGNMDIAWDRLTVFFSAVSKILAPFIYGLLIAYLLNVPMRHFENGVLGRIRFFDKHLRFRRILSVMLTYVFVGWCIYILIGYLFPEVFESFKNLLMAVPDNIKYFEEQYYLYLGDNNLVDAVVNSVNEVFSSSYSAKDLFDFAFKPIVTTLALLPNFFNTLLKGTVGLAYGFLNFVLGAVIAFYMLCDKDNFGRIGTKFLYAMFKRDSAQRILRTAKSSNKIFESFILGKVIDSIIIGIIFFFVAIGLKLPYATLLSVVIGVTNMIPYFGPFIGAIPVVFIVFLSNPASMQAVWTAVAILAVQQFDGIILGPKILGDSTGLSPIGVIFSIIVGGYFMGVFGMFFGVPIFAVIKNTVLSLVDKRYDRKLSEIYNDKGDLT